MVGAVVVVVSVVEWSWWRSSIVVTEASGAVVPSRGGRGCRRTGSFGSSCEEGDQREKRAGRQENRQQSDEPPGLIGCPNRCLPLTG